MTVPVGDVRKGVDKLLQDVDWLTVHADLSGRDPKGVMRAEDLELLGEGPATTEVSYDPFGTVMVWGDDALSVTSPVDLPAGAVKVVAWATDAHGRRTARMRTHLGSAVTAGKPFGHLAVGVAFS